jgi:hypothetical protein
MNLSFVGWSLLKCMFIDLAAKLLCGLSQDIVQQHCIITCFLFPTRLTCICLLFRNAAGRKQVYIQENACKQEITYSSVEECAISHYKSEGYVEGD